VVPWVAGQDGPRIEDVCERFGCTEAELAQDLELLFMCGLHPFTPDTLIEVTMEDGRVWIRYADYFSRPLRLTPADGLFLLAAGSTVLAVPGSDRNGPLAAGLAKLATVMGIEPEEAVDVELGNPSPEVLAVLQEGSRQRRQVEIDYYSYGRDAWSRRAIEPQKVFSSAGEWYAAGWCHQAGGRRVFRLDRMREAVLLEATFEPRDMGDVAGAALPWSPRPEDPVVVLELDGPARWVVDHYPNEGTEALEGDRVRVRLRAGGTAWLERLLLRLGPSARVIEGDASVASRAAAKVLRRYEAA
jgi:proteasome accessory factor C